MCDVIYGRFSEEKQSRKEGVYMLQRDCSFK